MKHMAIMGLMLAFTLPAAPAETETRDPGRILEELAEKRQKKRQEKEAREAQRIRENQRILDSFSAEFLVPEKSQEAMDAERDAERGVTPGTTARERQEAMDAERDAERGVTPGTTARERQEWEERQERERQERQARVAAERERQERTDALPPKARIAAELCHDADVVMKMAVGASRVNLGFREHSIKGEILHGIKTDRRYPPAAPEETALKLSRLARNLRKEAELWGFPCDP